MCSTNGRASSSSNVIVTSRSTIPVTFNDHALGSITGTCRAVSIR